MDYDVKTFIEDWVAEDLPCIEIYDTQKEKTLYKGNLENLPDSVYEMRVISVSSYDGCFVINCEEEE